MPETQPRIYLVSKTPSGEAYSVSTPIDITDIVEQGGKIFVEELPTKIGGAQIYVYDIYVKSKEGEVTRLNGNYAAENYLAVVDVSMNTDGTVNETDLNLKLRYSGEQKNPYTQYTSLYTVEHIAQYIERQKAENHLTEDAVAEIIVTGRDARAEISVTNKDGNILKSEVPALEDVSLRDRLIVKDPNKLVERLIYDMAYGGKNAQEGTVILDSALAQGSKAFEQLDALTKKHNLSIDKEEAAVIIAEAKKMLLSSSPNEPDISDDEQVALEGLVLKLGTTETGVTQSGAPTEERGGWDKDQKHKTKF